MCCVRVCVHVCMCVCVCVCVALSHPLFPIISYSSYLSSSSSSYFSITLFSTTFHLFMSSSHSLICILRKMDDDMPVMTGPQAAFELRKNLKFEGILCGVSGNTLEEDVKRFLDSGASYVLAKPLDFMTLKSLLFKLQNKLK